MILTGKAKEDFIKWIHSCYDRFSNYNFYKLDETLQYAIITEWFDSIGNLNDKGCVYNFKTLYLSIFKKLEKHHSILDIQKTIIEKANEIYNEKK